MDLREIIKKISYENIKEIEPLHRYHFENHKETITARNIKFWLRNKGSIEEIELIDNYIRYKVQSYIDYFENDNKYQELTKLFEKYKKSVEEYKNSPLESFNNFIKSYREFVYKWNEMPKYTKKSYITKDDLDIDLFDIDIIENNIFILHGKPLEGKTHNLIDIVKKNEENNILIFFANYFDEDSIKHNIISNLKKYNVNDFKTLLKRLNSEGERTNTSMAIIIDAINEKPYFDRDSFLTEINEIKEELNNYPYVKFLISIRSEYIDYKSYKSFHLMSLEKLNFFAIYNLCLSLGITEYFDISNFDFEKPVGFFYIIADTIEKMPEEDRKNITGYSKTEIFKKRLEQIKNAFNRKNKNIDSANVGTVFNKILSIMLKTKKLQIDIKGFTDDEKKIIDFFAEELLIAKRNNGEIEFTYQYYSDYYISDYIETNWFKELKENSYSISDCLIDIASKLIHTNNMIENFAADCLTSNIKLRIKYLLKFIQINCGKIILLKYKNILSKLNLSHEQKVILIENLREKYSIELSLKEIKKNEIKNAWKESVKNLPYSLISKNSDIIKMMNTSLLKNDIIDMNENDKNEIEFVIDIAFPDKLFLIHNYLLDMTLKKRDILYHYFFSKYEYDGSILHYTENMKTEEYKKIFKNFTEDKKLNELYRLIWVLGSRDREIRDKATVCLIYILKDFNNIYTKLWSDFKNINDPYILERMYLIGYGIIINSCNKDNEDIFNIAKELYIFAYPQNKHSYPHILIQEYGLRIYIWLLNNKIWQEPFHLKKYDYSLSFIKPFEDFKNNIENYIGKACSFSLRLECEGVYGDFGRYVYESNLIKFIENMYFKELEFNNDDKETFLNNLRNIIDKDYLDKIEEDFSVFIKNNCYTVNKKYNNLNMPLNQFSIDTLFTNYIIRNKKNILPLSFLGKHYIIQRIISDYITIPEIGNEKFEFFDESFSKDRHYHKKERYTKKMQWIGMFEYMGHIRNHFNYAPNTVKPEVLLYFYNFDISIKKKLLEYLSKNVIDFSLFSNQEDSHDELFGISSQVFLTLSDNSLEKQNMIYFRNVNGDIIYNIESGKEFIAIQNKIIKKMTKRVTNDEKKYIKNKFRNGDYIFAYGVQVIDATTGAFGVNLSISKEGNNSFDLRYSDYEISENFIFSNNISDLGDLIFKCKEKNEYDFSNEIESSKEMLNPIVVKKYNLSKDNTGYYKDDKLVVKEENKFWYIHKDFLKQIKADGYPLKWWGYYEKRKGTVNYEWDLNIEYNGDVFILNFISRYESYNFIVEI